MKKFISTVLLLSLILGVDAGPPIGLRIAAPKPAVSSGTTLFLDESGLGSADAAYSVARKLRSAYAGSAIRVRRSSDSTEQDIGFSSNQLDTSALATFCSGTDGFVVTIYDQSGNSRNLTQGTASAQPQIVSSGTIFTGANSKPECRFDGSNDRMSATSWTLASPITFFMVLKQITWVDNRYFTDGTTVNNMVFRNTGTTPTIGIITVSPTLTVTDGNAVVGTPFLATVKHIGTGASIQVNNNTASTGNLNNVSPGGVSVGSAGNSTQFNNMGLQEMVIYPASKDSTDQTTARNNINAFYSLY